MPVSTDSIFTILTLGNIPFDDGGSLFGVLLLDVCWVVFALLGGAVGVGVVGEFALLTCCFVGGAGSDWPGPHRPDGLGRGF